MRDRDLPPVSVLRAWNWHDSSVEPIDVGLVHQTYKVRADTGPYALQRLHPTFEASVNEDIERVTEHLAQRGIDTPRLVRTVDGGTYVEEDHRVWRALSWIEGRVYSTIEHPDHAFEAASLAARFHQAFAGWNAKFVSPRRRIHDLSRHLDHLRSVVARYPEHPQHASVHKLATQIFSHAEGLLPRQDLPLRIVHGDLKITNVVFDAPGVRARALIDLDTVDHGSLADELGDALRSWTNPAGESASPVEVDLRTFEAAVQGYANLSRDFVTESEIGALVSGAETISLELAARFCADALEESYFGWDSHRFASRSEHALARARSQLSLAASFRARRKTLESIVRAAFG